MKRVPAHILKIFRFGPWGSVRVRILLISKGWLMVALFVQDEGTFIRYSHNLSRNIWQQVRVSANCSSKLNSFVLGVRFIATPHIKSRDCTLAFKDIGLLDILPINQYTLYYHFCYPIIIQKKNLDDSSPRRRLKVHDVSHDPSILPIEKLHSPPGRFHVAMFPIRTIEIRVVFAVVSENVTCGVVVSFFLILFRQLSA